MGWSAYRKTGLTYSDPTKSCTGYTLLAPLQGDAAYLLDMEGRIVHRWHLPGYKLREVRLLPNGNLHVLCADSSTPLPLPDEPPSALLHRVHRLGSTPCLHEVTWAGEVVWEYQNAAMHHDFLRLPNGNMLVPERVELPHDLGQLVQGGIREVGAEPIMPLADDLVEFDTAGKEHGRIHLWQILDPVADPICPLDTREQWTHVNGLGLTSTGEVIFSRRQNSRVGTIDRRSGNLRRKFGAPQVFHQHHPTGLGNGNVQVFDNAMHRHQDASPAYSRVVEVNPTDSTIVWQYMGSPPAQFFSAIISSAERQPNGNVLICEGVSGRIFEVTQGQETVWEWVTPFASPSIFRAYRYAPDFAGLADKTLDPAAYADLNQFHGL